MSSDIDKKLEELFRSINKDGSDSITLAELKDYIQLQPSMSGAASSTVERAALVVLGKIDTNHTDTITLEEFKAFYHR